MALRRELSRAFFLNMMACIAIFANPSHARALYAAMAPSQDTNVNASGTLFSVLDYGAVADGTTDSSKAFQLAWAAACQSTAGRPSTFVVPPGLYSVGPLSFRGPCKDHVAARLEGQLLASTDLRLYNSTWIEFTSVDGLLISGGGTLDGQGASAWPHNQCSKSFKCKMLPESLLFNNVTNATFTGISLVNGKSFHMKIYRSNNIQIKSANISAPADSPNTDGIHIGDSANVNVTGAIIGTGDDCVSIGPGSVNVTVSEVFCGPGHGISIGSLGRYPNESAVVRVTVTNCTLTDTMNGLRIKSWQDTPSPLKASGLLFQDIVMSNTGNCIVIDQKYCPHNLCTHEAPSEVKIENVTFQNIRGTSSNVEAISIVCSDGVPCEGVHLSDIDLKYKRVRKRQRHVLTTTCVNVRGTTNGNVKPDISCSPTSLVKS